MTNLLVEKRKSSHQKGLTSNSHEVDILHESLSSGCLIKRFDEDLSMFFHRYQQTEEIN